MTVWLIGNRGMLGTEVQDRLRQEPIDIIATDCEVDVGDLTALRTFAGRNPDIRWIVNCSAYTAVDEAEEEPEAAFRINAEGVGNIARAGTALGAAVIHLSTDYVFDGKKESAYHEEDRPNPLSVYGKSKLQGEELLREACERHYLLRTAWLYGKHGKNFVSTMLRLYEERDVVRVVNDQWGSPTSARDLAGAIVHIIRGDRLPFGTYHYTNSGRTTWCGFAREIHRLALAARLCSREVAIVPIRTDEYPTKARRPANSELSTAKLRRATGLKIRGWQDALADFLQELERKA